ncbi:MAG: ABC transporter ATP-binding protein [Fluviicola sp.]|jgi:subfamily B ATP-binding cassette protein MsbA
MKLNRLFFKYTFSYKSHAILTIVFNTLFVFFNLISLVLFIPFLQLIFKVNQDKDEVINAPIWKGAGSIIEYCETWYKYTMNQMVENDPQKALLFVCISVFIAFFLKNIFRYGAIWYQSQLRMAVVRDIKNKLFEKALKLPLAFYTEQRKGDLTSRINTDVLEIEIAVVAVLEFVFREPIAIIINVAMLVALSPSLTLISFILLPLTAFVISRIGKSLKRTAKSTAEQNGLMFSSLDEWLGGMRIIKAFNAENSVFEKFKAINLRFQQLTTKTFRKRDLSPLINETLGAAVMLTLVWFGGKMILDKEVNSLSGEQFITFIIIFSQLLRPIQGISTSIANLDKAKPAMDRINEILHADEIIKEAEHPLALNQFSDSIKFENVSFKYGEEFVLKNVSFELKKGKTLALVGESGSGKSTIADLLPRFYEVTDGNIFIDGKNIKEYLIEDLRRHIGIVTQESILFNDTVANNILFGNPSASQSDVEEAARIAHADKFIQELEAGYETSIGERGGKLSGGQKQRISIARALLKDPSILVLDEATSALDTESEKIVQEALDNLLKGKTSLVIAHRLSTIIHAEEILVLSKGEVIERGSHQELMAKEGAYFNLCSLQGINK